MEKGRISLSYMFAFQKERSEKNDDLVPVFSFPVSERKEEKTFRYSCRREEKKMRSRDFLFFFSFFFLNKKTFRKERKGEMK